MCKTQVKSTAAFSGRIRPLITSMTAHASISVSVVWLLLFYREEISKISLKKDEAKVEE